MILHIQEFQLNDLGLKPMVYFDPITMLNHDERFT